MTFALPFTGLVTILTLLVYFWMMTKVGQARSKHDVKAPVMTGPEDFERILRVHANTVEGLVLFVPALWIFALLWGDTWAALVGVLYPIGRVLYAMGYYAGAEKRSRGFLVGFISTIVLLLGSLVGLLMAVF